MLCQNCNEREANVKYTQIINGVKKQMNLCDKCAKELGIDDISFNMPIHFSNFLGDIFEDEELLPAFIKPEILSCDKCGLSYDDFIKNGKFGCEKCYETFHSKMDSLLKNIHGVNRHVGRNGKMLGKENLDDKSQTKVDTNLDNKNSKLEKLKERLKQEIKEERYEDAAKTRDEIKKEEKN